MIQNIWQKIELYCGVHSEPIKMEIQEGPHSLFYACPKYYPENRDIGERACANRINLVDYEAMINYISKLLIDADVNNEKLVLANYKWTMKSIQFEIFEHEGEMIKIKMINKKALK